MKLFEGLICEKRDSCIWDDTQDSGSEASVKGPHTFLLGDPHKNMHDVAVPVERQNKLAQNHLPSCLPARKDNKGTNPLSRVQGTPWFTLCAYISLAVTAILARTVSKG